MGKTIWISETSQLILDQARGPGQSYDGAIQELADQANLGEKQ